MDRGESDIRETCCFVTESYGEMRAEARGKKDVSCFKFSSNESCPFARREEEATQQVRLLFSLLDVCKCMRNLL